MNKVKSKVQSSKEKKNSQYMIYSKDLHRVNIDFNIINIIYFI